MIIVRTQMEGNPFQSGTAEYAEAGVVFGKVTIQDVILHRSQEPVTQKAMEGHPSFQRESGYPGAKNHVRLPFFKRFKKGADFFRSVLRVSVQHDHRVVAPLDGMAIGDFLTAAVSQISFVSVGVEVVHALLVFIPDPYQVGIVGTGVVHDKDFLYPALQDRKSTRLNSSHSSLSYA